MTQRPDPIPRATSSRQRWAGHLTGGALQPGQRHPPATAGPATVRPNTQGAPPLTTRSTGAAGRAVRAAQHRSGEIRVAPPPRQAARPDRPPDRTAPPHPTIKLSAAARRAGSSTAGLVPPESGPPPAPRPIRPGHASPEGTRPDTAPTRHSRATGPGHPYSGDPAGHPAPGRVVP